MYEESSYIGSGAPSTDGYGFYLPAMPKQPVLLAAYQYGPDKLLTLRPDSRNQASHERDDRTLHVKLVRPLKIGYGRKVQTVLAEVTDGRADILGQKVVLRCFDTLYVSPDLLEVIPFCPPAKSSRFTDDGNGDGSDTAQSSHAHNGQSEGNGNGATSRAVTSILDRKTSDVTELTSAVQAVRITDDRNPSILLPHEYGDYQIQKGEDTPEGVLQPRRQFSEYLFENERSAYEAMSQKQCSAVPDYYGSYSVCFDRSEESWARVLVLKFVKGKSLATILDDMIDNPAGADQETADKISSFTMNAYDSVDQIHQSNVTHMNTEAYKCLVKKSGKFCWLDFTRAQRLDFEDESHAVDLLKASDLGSVNNFILRVCHDLEISYKFEDEESSNDEDDGGAVV